MQNKEETVDVNEIIYAFQLPLPRNGQVLRLHRSFQMMTCVLNLNINFNSEDQLNLLFNDENSTKVEQEMQFELKLAYNNDNKDSNFNDNWKLMAKNDLNKKFVCSKSNSYSVDCDLVQLFELGSVFHEYYLINLKFKENSQFLHKLTTSQSETTVLPDVRVLLTVSCSHFIFKDTFIYV